MELASRTRSLDLINLLLTTTTPTDGEPLGDLRRRQVTGGGEPASRTRSLDLITLLLPTTTPTDGDPLGDQVVASETVFDVNNVPGNAEACDLVGENDLCHIVLLYRPEPA